MNEKEILERYFQGEDIKISWSKLKELLEEGIITEKVYKKLKKRKQKAGKVKIQKKNIVKKENETRPIEKVGRPKVDPHKIKIIQRKNCDIHKIQTELKEKREDIKRLNQKLRECKSQYFKYGKGTEMTMRELLDIIKKENKDNVKDFLDLFPSTEERVKGVNVTRNHVYEALWIIIYLKELDNPSKKRQFYKSVEGGDLQSKENVLNSKVNSGSEGGIADIYFEMIGENEEIEADAKTTCNGKDILIPHCENKTIKAYDKYLFSSKYYSKTKGVSNYDIQDIFTEAIQKGLKEFNIVLLVQDKQELDRKMDTSNKSLSNLCHAIYGIEDLDVYYKQLLYQLKNKTDSLEEIKKYIKPRFHQQYFIEYTKQCMNKFKSKKFVWGAVPRSGKSYMIAGLVAVDLPKYVFLILGAITETKDQFIKMFRENNGDFDKYNIHDLQESHGKPQHNVSEGKHIFICSQEAIRMHNKKDTVNPSILNIFKSEKDKLVFFDEIHQGSGEESLQEDFLTELVFENDYKAFVMVTATFAKPFLKYMNKGGENTKLIQWRYDDIHLMKSIDITIVDEETGEENLITYEKIKENILEEEDGDLKLDIFNNLLKSYETDFGVDLERLAKKYKIYPELIVSTPIISDIDDEFSNIIVNGDIAVDKIFKPLMKLTPTDIISASTFIDYIKKNIYEKYILQTLNKGNVLRKPHSEIWFLPTMFRGEKGDEIIKEENKKGKKSPFGYMTKNFTTLLMQNEWFKEHYCVIILHSVGFDNVNIEFIQARTRGGKMIKWNDADVQDTGNHSCISTICPNSKLGVKDCVLQQEACARAHGKSVIILTGKMLRLGVSLPCVDIALHMDPIRSVDTIYQSMFRVLTEREGKTEGIFVDILTTRQISFMYEYMNYVSKTEKVFSSQKKMKKLLDKLLLFNFNGINFQKGQEYQDLYNKLMKEFSLDDLNKFNRNIRNVDVSEVNEMLQNFDERFIEEFYSILEGLNISYKVNKRSKKINKKIAEREGEIVSDEYIEIEPMEKKNPVTVKKTPELKEKYNEVSRFVKDIIMLFSLFSSETYEDIHDTPEVRKQIKKDIHDFFKKDIKNIKEMCESVELKDNSIIDCHLLNIIRTSVKDSELQNAYNTLKENLRNLFSDIAGDENFFNIYYVNIEEMKKVKKSSQDLKKVKPCSSEFIKDEKVLKIIRERLSVREEEKNLYGEVFTPIELICEMFEHIPDGVWKNPNLKWLDPANGIGNFPVVTYYKLMDSLKGYKPKGKSLSRHIIEDMLYMVELNPVNVRVCKKIFKMIDPKATPKIVKGDFLKFDSKKAFDIDKFDVIMGNPPFNDSQKFSKKKGGGDSLWNKFVVSSINEFLNGKGILCFVHPSSWRKPESEKSKTKGLFKIMAQDNYISYLEIHDSNDGNKIFGAGTRYDWYVLHKEKNTGKNTEIRDEKGLSHKLDLTKWDFLPNYNFTNVRSILTNSDKHAPIIYHTNYEPRKKWVSDKESQEFKYKLVHTTAKKPQSQSFYWTSSNDKVDKTGKNKMFGIKKVIFGDSGIGIPIIDITGDLGMTQHAMAIEVKNMEEAKQLKTALESESFTEVLNSLSFSNFQIDWRIFKYFKPDFYKYFLGKSSKAPSNEVYGDDPKSEGQNEKVIKLEPVAPIVVGPSRKTKSEKSSKKKSAKPLAKGTLRTLRKKNKKIKKSISKRKRSKKKKHKDLKNQKRKKKTNKKTRRNKKY